jgi:hypothetical protein
LLDLRHRQGRPRRSIYETIGNMLMVSVSGTAVILE